MHEACPANAAKHTSLNFRQKQASSRHYGTGSIQASCQCQTEASKSIIRLLLGLTFQCTNLFSLFCQLGKACRGAAAGLYQTTASLGRCLCSGVGTQASPCWRACTLTGTPCCLPLCLWHGEPMAPSLPCRSSPHPIPFPPPPLPPGPVTLSLCV